MERKIQRRQRRSKSWLFSPIVIAQLAVVMVIVGAGVSFAFTQNGITPDSAPWAGTADIDETANLDVTDYWFDYNAALTQVHSITIEITNHDTALHTTDIEAVILDALNGISWSDSTATPVSCTASDTTEYTFTFTADVDFDDVVKLNIVLTEKS